MGTSNICLHFITLLAGGDRQATNQKQIETIDAQLEECFRCQSEKHQKLNELRQSLNLLNDKTKKMDPNGMPRTAAINMTKSRMVAIISQIKQYEKLINWYTTMKINLENNQMSHEMATQMQNMKKQMLKTGTIDVNQLKEDFDDIIEINDDIQETQNIISDTLTNVWEMDIDGAEEELEAYLAEKDEVEDGTGGEIYAERQIIPNPPVQQMRRVEFTEEKTPIPVQELY